jgi:hypothetical protein
MRVDKVEAYDAWVAVGRPDPRRSGQPLWCAVCGERKEFQKSDNSVMPSSWYCHNWKDERHRGGKRPRDY